MEKFSAIKKLTAYKRQIIRGLMIASFLALYIFAVSKLGDVEKTELVSTEGRSFEKAVVTEIIKDNLQENGVRSGDQVVKVKMLSGEKKGEIFEATSSEGNLFGAVCEKGSKVIVIISTAGDSSLVSVYSLDREYVVYAFVGIFLLLICIIGGKNGIKSVLGLGFTMISIVYMYMPMIYRGFSPFWAAIIIVIITTIVDMYLIGGFTKKTVSAMLGTIMGVLCSGISAHLFGIAAGISGNNVSNIETLLFVGQNTKIQIGGLLFSGILIASLGAVMDVAVSVASTINEIYEKNPSIGRKELFKSGMNVGKDMMGTMSDTLIMAYTGGSLSALVVNYAYDISYIQLVNSYSIGIEIMQGISGSIGIILTVPFVSMVASALACTRIGKKSETTEC